MFLSHPLGFANLPDPIKLDRLKVLTEKIRGEGLTKAEEDEIVGGHLRLLLSLAQRWSKKSRSLSDVFVADGLYAMLMAIRQAKEKLRPDKTLTQFIIIKIVSAFKMAISDQVTVKVPSSDRKTSITVVSKGKTYTYAPKEPMKRHSLPSSNIEDTRINKGYVGLAIDKLISRPDQTELREIFNMCVKSSWERAVLELRNHNFTMQEIADKLKTTRREVSAALETIESRLRVLTA